MENKINLKKLLEKYPKITFCKHNKWIDFIGEARLRNANFKERVNVIICEKCGDMKEKN